MPYAGPCTVLGGLPLWAECNGGYDSFTGEYWSEVDSLHWQKRDGSKGAEISQKMYERIEKWDSYWQALVTEQVQDYLSCLADDAADSRREDRELFKFEDKQ